MKQFTVDRIADFIKEHQVAYKTIAHRPAFSAQQEAAATHVPGRMWAKTVLCFADDEPIQAVLPADLVVDVEELRALVGAHKLRLAREDELAALYRDCEVGAMPPLGPLYGHRVFVDCALAADPYIVFNAGTHTDAIRLRFGDFAKLVRPIVGVFACTRR